MSGTDAASMQPAPRSPGMLLAPGHDTRRPIARRFLDGRLAGEPDGNPSGRGIAVDGIPMRTC